MTARVVVLASGSGSNLQAIIDACGDDRLDAELRAVVSDRADAGALRRAATAGITGVHVPMPPRGSDPALRGEADARLADVVAGFAPDWVVLAGWMRMLSMSFLGWFPGQVVNLHPALPGELPGVKAIERAHAEAMAGMRTVTGVMVHLVPDEGMDDGPVLAIAHVPIERDDTIDSLAARIHDTEHRLLIDTLSRLCRTGANA